jgi:hypothetical protein
MTTILTPIPEMSPQNSELLREVQPLLDKITVLVKQLSPLHQLYLLQLIIQSLMQSLIVPTAPKGSPQAIAPLIGTLTLDDAAEVNHFVDKLRQVDQELWV